MAGICAGLALLGAWVALCGIGIIRLSDWSLERQRLRDTKAVREAAFVAQACAELRRKEVEASKRGDLLSAASYAELADRDYAVSMLDQQDMGEGWS
ncbi:hypothetical protein [Stenotrophomonas rhizophila]